MDHKLRLLIRLDVDAASAVIAVAGCLTMANYRALLPVLQRTRSLAGGIGVDIDLRGAAHVELPALEELRHTIARQYQKPGGLRVDVLCLDTAIFCPSQIQRPANSLQVAS